MTMSTHYEVLNCSRESSLEEVKQAYRRKLLECHPDKNLVNDAKNTVEFQKVQDAWTTLCDEESRRRYDAELSQNELETQSQLIFDVVGKCELDEENSEFFTYKCRCGDTYYINKEELLIEGQVVHVPCTGCTFALAVKT